jgi:hypothetical protein
VWDDAHTLRDTQLASGAVGCTLPGPLSIVGYFGQNATCWAVALSCVNPRHNCVDSRGECSRPYRIGVTLPGVSANHVHGFGRLMALVQIW